MLNKWRKNRPTKFSGDYYGLPSRWDLSEGLFGMYNACWSYQEVASHVARFYGTSDRQMRAEMVTSSLIAHRRKKMVGGHDGIDYKELVAQRVAKVRARAALLKEIEQRKELVGV